MTLEEDSKPRVVNTSMSVFGYWLVMFLVGVMPATGLVFLCALASSLRELLRGGSWAWLWYPALVLFGGTFLVTLYCRTIPGATTDPRGIALRKPWQSSTGIFAAWSDVVSLEVDFDARAYRSHKYQRVVLVVQDGSVQGAVACPFDVPLFREIVSRSELELREGLDKWQAKSDDPFRILERYKFSRQRWVWSRS